MLYPVLLTLAFLVGCGPSTPNSVRPPRPNTLRELPTLEGRYKAILRPLNSAVSGLGRGQILIQVMADHLSVKVQLKDGTPLVDQPQFLYGGQECPRESDDANDDGLVDPTEASHRLGTPLFALDSQLDTPEGAGIFPRTDFLGAFDYYQEGSVTKLEASFGMVELEGRVVAIHGVHPDTYLPGSVRSPERGSERESLVVACGVLERVELDETETSEPENL